MLRLLLDIHINPQVAEQVIAQRPNCIIVSLRSWKDGTYRTAPDAVILEAAHEDAMTLVTYDQKTVPRLLQEWASVGRSHAGVVFVDDKTIASHNVGSQIRGLVYLWDRRGNEEWTNRVVYLERSDVPS